MTVIRTVGPGLLLSILVSPVVGQGSALDRAPSRFASYEGIRVHYKSLGVGTTAVVFIHGWNCDYSAWRAQVPVVDGRVRAIFLDLPGFGRSDKPAVDYTMDYLAEGVTAVLHAAQVDRAVLVGHSMGTPVIRQFYRRHPAMVAGLVAVDGALRSYFSDTAAARPFLARFEGADYAANVEQMFDGMMPAGTDPEIRASIKRVAAATPQRVAVSAMRGMLAPAIWRDDPIDVPVLAVMAPNPAWTADYEAYVRRLAPGIQYETIKAAGHFVMLDHPNEFNGFLTEFLRARRLIR